jgi:predicted DNA-binding transcriptional regulator YafY
VKKYLNQTIEIVYLDRHGKLSQRRVRVVAVTDGVVRAYDFERRAPRIFKLDNIMAIQPVRYHAQ